MRQITLMLGAVCLAVLCGAGVWLAARPPVAPFQTPEALDPQVLRPALSVVEISYPEPASGAKLRRALASRLIASGWIASAHYPALADADHETFTHIFKLLSLEIWDQADISADAQAIRIRVRRWYISPWGHVP